MNDYDSVRGDSEFAACFRKLKRATASFVLLFPPVGSLVGYELGADGDISQRIIFTSLGFLFGILTAYLAFELVMTHIRLAHTVNQLSEERMRNDLLRSKQAEMARESKLRKTPPPKPPVREVPRPTQINLPKRTQLYG